MESADGQARDAESYLVAGCTPWARRVFDERLSKLPGKWRYVDDPNVLLGLTLSQNEDTDQRRYSWRYAFFLHWRWKVPVRVLEATECIGFHLGAFSEYRGGTPLQHQIFAGERFGTLTVYRMTDEVDSGPIYDTKTVALDGSAEAVYARSMDVAARVIAWFVGGMYDGPRAASPTVGPLLPRRIPADSNVVFARTPPGLESIYDHVRMLDAEGYPHAYVEDTHYRYTFRRAVLYDGRVECDCTITVREGNGE